MQILSSLGVLIGTVLLVLFSIEAGFRLGHFARRRSEDEKETPVSAIAGSILGLLAFILAFTFGIVSGRYDTRRALVREEANAIGTAYLRSDFLPEADRAEASDLFMRYVQSRVAAQHADPGIINAFVRDAELIQRRLWTMAVTNARKDMNSDVAALYVEALNQVFELHAQRVSVGLQSRIPTGIWVITYTLMLLGMLAIGYQTGIAGSRRSLTMLILALSFSLVIGLINALDNPFNRLIPVSQKPMENLLSSMSGQHTTNSESTTRSP